MKKYHFPKYIKNSGFTLVEMAIVLLVFGLVIGGLMGPLQTQLESLDRKVTVKEVDLIKEAITGFAIRNGYLPCPDDLDGGGDGEENVNGTGENCAKNYGVVPWVTLGVGHLDGWKQPFTYYVDTAFSDRVVYFTKDTNGTEIKVYQSKNKVNFVTSNQPAIIISHGKNWAQGSGFDEAENDKDNVHLNGDFVDKTYLNGSLDNNYDDIVDWVNLNNLIAKMVAAGRLP